VSGLKLAVQISTVFLEPLATFGLLRQLILDLDHAAAKREDLVGEPVEPVSLLEVFDDKARGSIL
jgi:hypothetical protein